MHPARAAGQASGARPWPRTDGGPPAGPVLQVLRLNLHPLLHRQALAVALLPELLAAQRRHGGAVGEGGAGADDDGRARALAIAVSRRGGGAGGWRRARLRGVLHRAAVLASAGRAFKVERASGGLLRAQRRGLVGAGWRARPVCALPAARASQRRELIDGPSDPGAAARDEAANARLSPRFMRTLAGPMRLLPTSTVEPDLSRSHEDHGGRPTAAGEQFLPPARPTQGAGASAACSPARPACCPTAQTVGRITEGGAERIK